MSGSSPTKRITRSAVSQRVGPKPKAKDTRLRTHEEVKNQLLREAALTTVEIPNDKPVSPPTLGHSPERGRSKRQRTPNPRNVAFADQTNEGQGIDSLLPDDDTLAWKPPVRTFTDSSSAVGKEGSKADLHDVVAKYDAALGALGPITNQNLSLALDVHGESMFGRSHPQGDQEVSETINDLPTVPILGQATAPGMDSDDILKALSRSFGQRRPREFRNITPMPNTRVKKGRTPDRKVGKSKSPRRKLWADVDAGPSRSLKKPGDQVKLLLPSLKFGDSDETPNLRREPHPLQKLKTAEDFDPRLDHELIAMLRRTGVPRSDDYYANALQTIQFFMREWTSQYFDYHNSPVKDKTGKTANDRAWAGLSDELIGYICSIAGCGDNWREFIEHPPSRMCLVYGLLAKLLEEHVFDCVLFGATHAQEQALTNMGKQFIGVRSFKCQKWLSMTVCAMLDSSETPNDFVTNIGETVARFITLIEPLLPAQDRRTKDFMEHLWDVIEAAAKLAIEIRCEPTTIYRFVPIPPDTEFNPDEMDCRYDATPALPRIPAEEAKMRPLVWIGMFPGLLAYRSGTGLDDGRKDGWRWKVVLKPEVAVYDAIPRRQDTETAPDQPKIRHQNPTTELEIMMKGRRSYAQKNSKRSVCEMM